MNTSHEPALSIVVPMYNCEDYVNELLGGFAQQSFENFEVICVNDGSTDNTLSLVKAFCETDSRFQYIDKVNGGAGSARNAGMDIARGKYIAFLDADDEYNPNWFKEMYETAEAAQADITICQFRFIDKLRGTDYDNRGLYAAALKAGKVVTPGSIEDLLVSTNPAPTNKLYLLSFLKRVGLRYTDSKIAQDLVFTFSALSVAERIIGLPNSLTTVRSGVNASSISSNRHKNRMDALLAIRRLYEWLKEHNLEDTYEESFLKVSKNTILWETNFQCEEDYLRAAAQMVQNNAPWCYLPSKKKMSYWSFNLASMGEEVSNLEKEIADNGETETLQAQLRSATNRYESAKLLTELIKMETPAISVVIPMYNCEQYVEPMLGAIAAQTFTDFEVICVNDGSTDNTLSLIKEVCAKDKRFTCLSQENGGAGAARNTGIDAASGKYVMFLDADDEYFPTYFQEMYQAAEKHQADEVFCLYDDHNYRDGTERRSIGFSRDRLPEDTAVATESIPYVYGIISWSIWNTILKKELIDRYALRFSTTKVANDIFFIYAYASIAKTLVGVHKKLLRRRRNHNVHSITSSRWKHTEDVVSAYKDLYSWIQTNNLSPSYLEMCRILFINNMTYDCGFPFNEKYAEAVAQLLCEGEMWKDVEPKTFYDKYWKKRDTTKIQEELSDLQTQEDNTIVEAQKMSNRIHAIERIEEIAYRKYGRILNPHHYYTEVASIKSELAQVKKKNIEQEEKIKSISDALKKEKRNVKKANQKVDKVKNSRTYKAGQYITWFPKKVYHGLGLSKSRKNEGKHTTPFKVSVIIPVYNVEPYIRRCLDSLVNQTLKEIEFIFVDDCGQDNSMKIVQEYRKRDPRIKILKNPSNLGAGPSRNKGIEEAKGEYLAFVDPDDWVSPNAYEVLYKKALADRADVVKGNVQFIDEEGNECTPDNFVFSNSAINKYISKGIPLYRAIRSNHWTMIYSKQLLNNQSIRYGSTRSAQDGVFLLNVFLNTDKVSFCDEVVYHYLVREDGLSGIGRYQRHTASLESLKERIQILNHKGIYDIHYYEYITNYSNYALDNFKKYLKGDQKVKQDEISDYLKRLEDAITLAKDPSRIFNNLPYYKELKYLQNCEEIKVSVIVPVYNAEPYIRRCLDSLVNQTLKDLEFIFVDDCGQDNSMKIVQEYQRHDSRIKILKNPSNLGAGPSRNKGIEAAEGEYLAFVDPDDWVGANAYEALHNKALADHADVVKGNVQILNAEGKDITQEKPHFNNPVVKQRLSKGMPHYAAITCAHFAMIFSKQLVSNQSIQYGSMRSAEDGLFLLQVFLATDKVSFCDDVVYHYCRRDEGLSSVTNINRHFEALSSLRERITILNNRGSFDTYYYQYLINYISFLLKDFKKYIDGNHNEKRSVIEKYLKEFEEVVNLSKDSQQIFDALPIYHELSELK